MSENTEDRVARLAAELAEAQAELERENQRKAKVRDEALARVARELLSSVVDHHVRYVFETSDLSDLPVEEALLEDYEEGEMNLVFSRLCDRKGYVSAGYRVDEGNSSYPYSETVALTVLVPLSEVQPLMDKHMPR